MDYVRKCPGCGEHAPNEFILGSGYFEINKCDDCGKRYCYQCPGSDNGSECPRCGSGRSTVVARCQRG